MYNRYDLKIGIQPATHIMDNFFPSREFLPGVENIFAESKIISSSRILTSNQ